MSLSSTKLCSEFLQSGLQLWVENEQLCFRAPRGVLTSAWRAALSEHKQEIAALLCDGRRYSPLSFAQERLWLAAQLDPEGVAYNVAKASRLTGPLNLTALEQSLNEIVTRHEILRTVFGEVDGKPVQMICPARPSELEQVDLTAFRKSERMEEALRLAGNMARRPFDLTQGPLLRTALLRLSSEDHLLILAMHHIVSDGWSIGVFVKEIATLYAAFSKGQPSTLALLFMQYADFACWQRQLLTNEVLNQEVSFLKRQLAGAPPVLELPTDRARPVMQTFRGARYPLALTQELTGQLKALSWHEGATLFMTLLAAFQTLLHRYTEQQDIVIGSPVANRNQAEIKAAIGFFVNTLVLRTRLTGESSFREVLRHVRDVSLEAYAHQDLPFAKLVEALQPQRSPGHSPLFQVMFVLQSAPLPSFELPGLLLDRLEIDPGIAMFDLTLTLEERGTGLSGFFEYNSDLFDESSIKRMAGHFERLLEDIVVQPEKRLRDLTLLTQPERQLMSEWNETARAYPGETCIHKLFEAQVEQLAGKVAVVHEDRQLTYGELNRRANQVAHYLRSLGVRPEVRVGIFIERSVEMIVALLGVLKAGAAYVPLDSSLPHERFDFMLNDSGALVLLTLRRMLKELPEVSLPVVCLDEDWEVIARESDENPFHWATSENLAYVMYTSGSRGVPKGVMIRHQSLVNFTMAASVHYELKSTDRVLQFASLSFDNSTEEIYPCFIQGATLVLRTDEMLASVLTFLQQCEDWRITVLSLPTAFWHEVVAGLEVVHFKPASLRLVILGGERAIPERLALWQKHILSEVRLLNTYGPTEATVIATLCELPRTAGTGLREVPIGRAIDNTQIHLLDSHLQLVPVGVPGELYIAGEGLARGYLGRPRLTAEHFIPNPFSSWSGACLYRTGDVGRYLPDGNIEFLGRVDQQVKLRGYRVELGEIEAVLSQHEAVREAVVVAREETAGDKQLVAYFLTPSEAGPSAHELRSFLQSKLPEYMLPTSFVRLDQLPLTPTGKIDRRALPAPPGTRPSIAAAYMPPRTPLEELLAGVWAELLGVEQVGSYDNFFELGGHSLLAIRLISRLRELLAVSLPLRSIFEAPTIRSMTERIETALREEQQPQLPPLRSISRNGELPLSFAQQRLWFLDQLEPDNVAYNMPAAMRLRGQLNLAALTQALNEVVQRHETLRTRFVKREDQPVQVIAPHTEIRIPFVSLRGVAAAERETEVGCLAAEEAHRPFSLAEGPLLRVCLLQLDENEHVLLLTMHHIISDGRSVDVLAQEVAAFYEAYSTRQPPALPQLPIQYADYVVWQQEWLQGETLASQISYWRDQLAGIPVLEIPTDRARPAVQTYRGAKHEFMLEQELSGQLKTHSRNEGVTLFMTLLAAFALLLKRYSGQEEIVVGTVTAGRNQIEVENLIGLFVNTLALRVDLSGEPSCKQLLGRVREMCLGAYAHQDAPFEKLVEQLQPERDTGRHPLFQVMMVLQNGTPQAIELAGLKLSPVSTSSGIAKFDMTLYIEEQDESLKGTLEYNTDLFYETTVTRMVEQWKLILEGMVTSLEQSIERLPMLTEAECQRLLVQWNATKAEYPENKCLHELLEAQVERTPDASALIFADERVTYRELNSRANRVARYLRKLGVRAEIPVGICMERSIEMVIGLLGILKAGGAYLPLDSEYPPERLAFMLDDSDASFVLTQQRLVTRLPKRVPKVVCLDADWEEIERESSADLHSLESVAEQPAYIMYTSGSTGQPKGIAGLHRGTVNRFCWMWAIYPFEAGEVCCQKTNLSFGDSVWEILGPLLQGVASVIIPDRIVRDPPRLIETLALHHVTRIVTVPSLLRTLLDSRPELLSRLKELKYWVTSGEALSAELARRFQKSLPWTRLINLYGSSELSADASCYEIEDCDWETSVPIGKPIWNMQIYVLDKRGQVVPIGVIGEVHVSGEGLARGYWRRPDLTAEKFVPNPFSETAGARLYKTGDLGRYRMDGNIEYQGRIDHQVKLRGYRIELGEVEAALREHSAISEAVVLAREDEEGERRLMAYFVAPEVRAPSANSLRNFLREKLPAYMIPASFFRLEALPLTPNGKLDRQALFRRNDSSSQLEEIHLAPRGRLEQIIAGIWQEILRVEKVGRHSNFFDLGGHSLILIKVQSKLQAAFAADIELIELFQYPTVASLAKHLSRQKDDGSSIQQNTNYAEIRQELIQRRRESGNRRRAMRSS